MEQDFEKEKKNGAMLQESEWESRVKMVQAVTTKAEQKVAAWLMEQSGQLGQMTLREVASGAGVGQPTVIRLLKKAGFSGWNDFLHMVWKEKKLLDEKYEIQLPAALSCMQEDIAVIREMAQHLNLKAMKKLASVIKKAHLIDIYGTANSAGAASELSGKLLHMGLPSRNYSDLFYQKVSAGHLEAKDIAIGFSMSGETEAVVDALSAAKLSQAVTVAVTADTRSTLTNYADFVFYTPTFVQSEASRWISSRITQTVFVDALCMTLLESDTGYFNKNLHQSTSEFEKDVLNQEMWSIAP